MFILNDIQSLQIQLKRDKYFLAFIKTWGLIKSAFLYFSAFGYPLIWNVTTCEYGMPLAGSQTYTNHTSSRPIFLSLIHFDFSCSSSLPPCHPVSVHHFRHKKFPGSTSNKFHVRHRFHYRCPGSNHCNAE